MELAGQLCTVRPWRITDVPPLVKYANNAHIARQLRDRFPHPYPAADARHFIHAVAGARTPTSFAIVIDDEAAGAIGISPGADVERFSAEIGYWLGEPFWGRGIVPEALRLVSAYAFDTCNMLRLFALPFADNVQSIRALEKAGYLHEAILRASSVKHGQVRDQALFSLVNAHWKGI